MIPPKLSQGLLAILRIGAASLAVLLFLQQKTVEAFLQLVIVSAEFLRDFKDK